MSGDDVTGFVDRRSEPKAAGVRFCGMAVFEPEAARLVPSNPPQGLGETVLRVLAEEGRLAAHVAHGYVRDVGTPSTYLAASIDLLAGRAPPPPGGLPGAIVDVPGGRAYVGPGAQVRAEDLGPDAVILRAATVAPGSRITRSIVWPKETVPRGLRLNSGVWAQGRAINAV